jgi:hypothetical protein
LREQKKARDSANDSCFSPGDERQKVKIIVKNLFFSSLVKKLKIPGGEFGISGVSMWIGDT